MHTFERLRRFTASQEAEVHSPGPSGRRLRCGQGRLLEIQAERIVILAGTDRWTYAQGPTLSTESLVGCVEAMSVSVGDRVVVTTLLQ